MSIDVSSFGDLLNARPFDVHVWSEYPEVNDFVNSIYGEITSVDGHERLNKRLLKVLLLDLYVAWCADPSLKIMFSRDNNSYKAKSRYNELHIGKKIVSIVDKLQSNNLICEKRGFNDKISGVGFQSRLWPTAKLIEHFKQARFSQFQISHHAEREVIILRDEDKNDVEYSDEPTFVTHTRSLLKDYNRLLARTHIGIADLDKPVIDIGNGTNKVKLQISQKDKFVRRIFNNSNWKQGGRFYGGWWQRCPSSYRSNIEFDGILGAEVDFSGLHIVILYAQLGINYWSEIGEDPYALNLPEDLFEGLDTRLVAKSLLLTALNAAHTTEAFQAFRQREPSGSPMKRLTDVQLNAVLVALKKKHSKISDKIASGIGIELMFLDSEITRKIIERFTYHYKCPILTIHDSYIVPFGYDRVLVSEMQQAFAEVTGVGEPVVKHTTDYFDILQEPIDDGGSEIKQSNKRSPRHIRELEEFKLAWAKDETESWYPNWTMIY